VRDSAVGGTTRGDKRHAVVDVEGKTHEISGTYYLSNLLQELELARESGSRIADIDPARIYEDPPKRISRVIRERFWDNLTRRIDSVMGMADKIMKSEHLASPVHSGRHVYRCFWFRQKFAAATPAACPVAKAVPMTRTEEPAY